MQPLISDEDAIKLYELSNKLHCKVYSLESAKKDMFRVISNAMECLYYNGGLSTTFSKGYYRWLTSSMDTMQKTLFKLRGFYERSKTIRRRQSGELRRYKDRINNLIYQIEHGQDDKEHILTSLKKMVE